MYRDIHPNDGFRILREIAEEMPYGSFAFTSNVDGHFQKSGFPEQRVCEVHGSIHHFQCAARCGGSIWHAGSFQPTVDEAECRLVNDLPSCPHCGSLARPNILMFGDWEWRPERQQAQMGSLHRWLDAVANPVVVEIGAGTAIPTVRHFGENTRGRLIRINRKGPETYREGDVSLRLGGLEALSLIAAELGMPVSFPTKIPDSARPERK